MSTYLGSGVSIPHGMFENREHILQTGISVLQLTDGVEWDEGEKVYLVIGIAASSDEHVGVLSNLADVIDNEEALAELTGYSREQLVELPSFRPLIDPDEPGDQAGQAPWMY